MNAITCPRLADSGVLTAVQKRTRLEPYAFTGIKWTTIKLTMANNRDLCYFEKVGMVRQATGKRMAYHVMQSVELPEYSSKMTHQRAHVSLCYVFEELEDDLVGVYMKGDVDIGTLSFFVTKAVSDVMMAFVNALECTRAKKLTLMMTTATRLAASHSSSSRKNCSVCKSSPSFFDNFTECAGCNKPVCKKCRFRETVLTRDTMPSHPKRADFCRHCFTKMNMLSTEQLRNKAHEQDTPAEKDTRQVDINMLGSERSLMSFVFNISTQVQGLSNDSEVRASNLSSMGWASSDEEGEEVDIDNESEGRDILKSSRLKSTPMVIYEKPPANATRRSRSSTSSTASSFAHEEDDSEQYQISLMAKLQQMSQQVEDTLLFTREQSEVARSVRERTRSNRLLQERSSVGSSSSRF